MPSPIRVIRAHARRPEPHISVSRDRCFCFTRVFFRRKDSRIYQGDPTRGENSTRARHWTSTRARRRVHVDVRPRAKTRVDGTRVFRRVSARVGMAEAVPVVAGDSGQGNCGDEPARHVTTTRSARRGRAMASAVVRFVRTRAGARARAIRPWLMARATAVAALVRREFEEQFPSDEAWLARMEELDELAAFEAAMAFEEAANARQMTIETASVDAEERGSIDRVGNVDEEDEEEGKRRTDVDVLERLDDVVARLDAIALDDDVDDIVSEAETSTSYDATDAVDVVVSASPVFDEADYVYETSPESDHRVVVVPEALLLDGSVPQSSTVSFVAPRKLTGMVLEKSKASAYWAGTRRSRDEFSAQPLVIRARPSPPVSPECPIPSPVATQTKAAYSETPPWYMKRLDGESRKLAKTARTILDWTTEAAREILFEDSVASDANATQKTKLDHVWFDTGECDLVIGVPCCETIALDAKRD
jgi:hypothetical protein